MSTIHGRNAVVYLQGSGATAAQISKANAWQLQIDKDLEADASFGDTWETRLQGLLRFSGSINGHFDTAQGGNSVWESSVATSSRKMYLYPSAGATTQYYYGNVWPKLSINMPMGVGQFSMSFEGDGQLAING